MFKTINYNAQTGETTQIEVPDELTEQVEPVPQEPTIEERLNNVETDVVTVKEILEVIYG